MAVIERKTNGRIDWHRNIRTFWPIIIVVGMVFMYFTDRLETDGEKQERINATVAPVVNLIERNTEAIASNTRTLATIQSELRDHDHMEGHVGMMARVAKLEEAIDRNYGMLVRVQQDIKQLLRRNGG